MSIFVDKKTTEIAIRYVETDGKVRVLEGEERADGEVEVKFTFRKPNWGDTRRVMGSAAKIDGEGNSSIDTYKFMDGTIKTLLVDWTLKDANGIDVAVDDAAIDSLPFEIVRGLFKAVIEKVQMPGK